MQTVDLHIHSNYSDGSDSLEELVKAVKASNLSAFALTDHDEIQGCKDIRPLLPEKIQFINGTELTCKIEDIKCHILGFNIDIENKDLIKLIQKGKQLRRSKLETRIAFLRDKWGIELTEDELSWLYSRRSVVKIHLANILVNRGLAEDNIPAMNKYFEGCKTGNSRFDGDEAISTIIKAGGIPIWAHPLGGEGETHLTEEEFLHRLEIMKRHGIKGLECYYSRYSQSETDFLVSVAKKNNLFISGGSDYHGSNKNNISIANYLMENLSAELFNK